MIRTLALLSLLAACKGTPASPEPSDDPTPVPTAEQDADNDGYTASIDCDDNNATINPGALEQCNGVDDDCNDQVDDNPVDGVTAYADADLDTYGDEANGISICGTVPDGYVSTGGDCNDDDAHIYPGATEFCDNTDSDCDGTQGYLDPDAGGNVDYYVDSDNDGHGTGSPVTACTPPSGYVLSSDDCDDTNPAVYTGANEVCDTYDNDCDGDTDEDLDVTWYLDDDADGYGVDTTTQIACAQPLGYAANSQDCDDTTDAVYPGAIEICDEIDNDCDEHIDDDDEGVDAPSYYSDADQDGYGVGDGTVSCLQPPDTSTAGGDCDDDDGHIYPGASEVCDGVDNDCDTFADDEDPEGPEDGSRFYWDDDLDGYGDPDDYVDACVPPDDVVANGDDCDDEDPHVNPAAIEICNAGIDDNCDEVIDDDDPHVVLASFYDDQDGDGYGIGDAILACVAPQDTAPQSGDCDDNNEHLNPGEIEACDEIDNDCDELIDDEDDDVDAPYAYLDEDFDTYGAEPGTRYCIAPLGTIPTGGDCNDEDHTIYPGALEICDQIDNDCDELTDDEDDDVQGELTAYVDEDLDGYGFGNSVLVCVVDNGYADNDTDCDDTRDYVYPGATEVCDTYDNDCDGHIDDEDDDLDGDISAYLDEDEDGYGVGSSFLVCALGPGYADNGDDCDDADAYVRPGVFDWGSGSDLDCDGDVDEDVGTETYNSVQVQAIWDSTCGPCHLSSAAGGLSLTNGYASTVGVDSVDVPEIYQITPGRPIDSYIWASLTNTRADVGGQGGIMPPSGPLSQDDLDLIETWILEGAVQ